jgi:hypothetical protein
MVCPLREPAKTVTAIDPDGRVVPWRRAVNATPTLLERLLRGAQTGIRQDRNVHQPKDHTG